MKPIFLAPLSILCCLLPSRAAFADGSIGKSDSFELVLNVSPEYTAWLAEYFTEQQRLDAALVAESADSDGDGHSNLFEFLAKLDPTDIDSRFRMYFADGTGEYLHVGPIVDGVAYDVQLSADLKIWFSVDSAFHVGVDDELQIDLRSLPAGSFYRVVPADDGTSTGGFALISAGSFTMGSPEGELGRGSDETARQVTLTKEFFMAKAEVTWKQWSDVRVWGADHEYADLSSGRNGGDGDSSGNHPVTEVSWWDAIKWCNARSEMDGRIPVYYTTANFGSQNILRSGTPSPFADWNTNGYRLPTEAEWEYACRAGTSTTFYTGAITNGISDPNLDAAGWYFANSESNTHAVGGKQANAWGLFDMHGNVWERCWDWYGSYVGTATDPRGSESGERRVLRGGGWRNVAENCRSAIRSSNEPTATNFNIGFRVALSSNP